MPQRDASRGIQGFIWLPRTAPTFWKIFINSVEVTTDIFPEAEFTKALCPEVWQCKIDLINADGRFTGIFQQTQTVELYIDYVDGSTRQFLGKIDTIKNTYADDKGYVVHIEASNSFVYDVTISESYAGTDSFNAILAALIAKYIPSITLNYIATSTDSPSITWDGKTFWDAVNDLAKLAGADAYLDENYVLQFFDKESILNLNEGIVWNDTLVDAKELGKQIVTAKNKIIVYGDDGTGLPVIATENDSASQTAYGTKESIIFNSDISDPDTASQAAVAELDIQANPNDEGDCESLILPSLDAGEKCWITDPPLGIHGQFKIYSLTHKFPSERTTVSVFKQRTTKQVLKKITTNTQAATLLTNPYKMIGSFNFYFDDYTELSSYDANVIVVDGNIKLSSGTQGVFTTNTLSALNTITEIHLLASGSSIAGTTFQISGDGGATYEDLVLNGKKVLNTPNSNLILKVILQSASTNIDSIALLYQ